MKIPLFLCLSVILHRTTCRPAAGYAIPAIGDRGFGASKQMAPSLPFRRLTSLSGSGGDGSVAGLSAREARIATPLCVVLASVFQYSPGSAEAIASSSTEAFESALKSHFRGALRSSVVSLRVMSTLRKRHYRPYNTLMGSSLCSDEVNDTRESLLSALSKSLTDVNDGGVFNLGGLGGLPLVGATGFDAFVSHCPENGNIFILFGPHVGISQTGHVGKVERIGQDGRATVSCGAAIEAYDAIMAGQHNLETSSGVLDFQEDYIIRNLKRKMGNLTQLNKSMAGDESAMMTFVTQQMYGLVWDLLQAEFAACTAKPAFWDHVKEVALLGGIVVNRGHGSGTKGGEDYFQPLMMKVCTAQGETNLYDQVFGDLPVPRILTN